MNEHTNADIHTHTQIYLAVEMKTKNLIYTYLPT